MPARMPRSRESKPSCEHCSVLKLKLDLLALAATCTDNVHHSTGSISYTPGQGTIWARNAVDSRAGAY